MIGSEDRPARVAIVGSGPSAFYAAEALQKAAALFPESGVQRVCIDMFDRLPTPFGLVRGGVAPDHQKIKNVVRIYEEIASQPDYRFFGNVTVGRDVGIDELRAHYDQIVLAVGAESDRRLGIEGEDLDGVHSATSFVGWYNGHPDHRDHRFRLDEAKRVAVVGNGNVAIDVCRILMRTPEQLAETDIADHAMEALAGSAVEEVVLLGRRGPAQAAFSPKEIKEVSEVEGVWLSIDPADAELDPVSEAWMQDAPRSAQRNVQFLQKQAQVGRADGTRRTVRCRFCVSPVSFSGEDGRLRSVKLQHAELRPDERGTPRPRPIDSFEDLEVDLVFKAIGYRGIPLEGVPFDERSGTIPNLAGRVLDRDHVVPGTYVVGWAKRGPTGLIGTNSPDSKATVQMMVEDMSGTEPADLPSPEVLPRLLAERGVDVVSWEDWQRLDRWEKQEGEAAKRIRRKLSRVDEMMAAIARLRAGEGAA